MKSLLILLALCAPVLLADPCGMVAPVPPIVGPKPLIKRQGAQKTYVFYKDGVETFAVRPGFIGNVDNFGMLIPVPSMPAIRKIHDDMFAHIAAAIDPPLVEVEMVSNDPWDSPNEDLSDSNESPHPNRNSTNSSVGLGGGIGGGGGARWSAPTVHLLKEEAVGMYQVVVLQAGNAEVLKEWMAEHGYVFPEGMDSVCNDYVKAGWLFVAVKAKIGSKANANPALGMTSVDASRKAGSLFEGHVQGMAFRFKTPELVVPMRLSSYNKGKTRNIVYVLTDKPTAIKDMPQKHVRRQVSGEQLYLNLTQYLPLEFVNCTKDDFSVNAIKELASSRNPSRYNGLARELFSADLLAVQNGQLEQEFEALEKRLLNISEKLDLRGPEMDKLHRIEVRKLMPATMETAILELLDMTLTVIDGNFPRKILRRDNLLFVDYAISSKINNPAKYNEYLWAIGDYTNTVETGGWTYIYAEEAALARAKSARNLPILERNSVAAKINNSATTVEQDFNESAVAPVAQIDTSTPTWVYLWLSIKGLLVLTVAIYMLRKRRTKAAKATATMLILTVGMLCTTNPAYAKKVEKPTPAPAMSEEQVDALVESGDVTALSDQAFSSRNIEAQGWALYGLAKVADNISNYELHQIERSSVQSKLVKTWSVGALVQCTTGDTNIADLLPLVQYYPMITEGMAKRLAAMDSLPDNAIRTLFGNGVWRRSIKEMYQPIVMVLPPKHLVKQMLTGSLTINRQVAAAYLGAMARTDEPAVHRALIEGLKPIAGASEVPWGAGSLFLPSLTLTDRQVLDISAALMEWAYIVVHSKDISVNDMRTAQRVIVNNVRPFPDRLAEISKTNMDDPLSWFSYHSKQLGNDRVKAFLERHSLLETPKGKLMMEGFEK